MVLLWCNHIMVHLLWLTSNFFFFSATYFYILCFSVKWAQLGSSGLLLLVCCSQMAPGLRTIMRCPARLDIQDSIFPYMSDMLHEACSPRVSIPETKVETIRFLLTQSKKTRRISCIISYFQENQSSNSDSGDGDLTRAWILKGVIHCGTSLNTSFYPPPIFFFFSFLCSRKAQFPFVVWTNRVTDHYSVVKQGLSTRGWKSFWDLHTSDCSPLFMWVLWPSNPLLLQHCFSAKAFVLSGTEHNTVNQGLDTI